MLDTQQTILRLVIIAAGLRSHMVVCLGSSLVMLGQKSIVQITFSRLSRDGCAEIAREIKALPCVVSAETD